MLWISVWLYIACVSSQYVVICDVGELFGVHYLYSQGWVSEQFHNGTSDLYSQTGMVIFMVVLKPEEDQLTKDKLLDEGFIEVSGKMSTTSLSTSTRTHFIMLTCCQRLLLRQSLSCQLRFRQQQWVCFAIWFHCSTFTISNIKHWYIVTVH